MTDTGTHSAGTHARRSRRGGTWLDELTTGGRVALVGVAVLFVGALLVVGVDLLISAGRIHPGVSVGDVPVGSLTVVEARARVEAEAATRLARPVAVTYGAKTWKVTGDLVGAKVDVIGSVARADAVGRTGGLGRMVSDRVRAVFGGTSVLAKVDGDPALVADLMSEIERTAAVPARDASVAVEGTGVRLIPAKAGVRVRRAVVADRVLGAFFTDLHAAAVATEVAPASISDADAAQALEDSRRLLSGPVTVVYKGATHNVAREDVATWVTFEERPLDQTDGEGAASTTTTPSVMSTAPSVATTEPAPGTRYMLVAGLDPARMARTIAPFTKGMGRPAVDAKFVAAKGRVTIRPSQVGSGPDLAALAHDLADACISGRPRSAELKLAQTQPRLTTEQAKAMGVADRIGSFTTTFDAGNRPRTNNIRLLAAALDAKLVPPGGTFSFNRAAGERTASKGYQEAPAIVNGKLVPQLGGGVCQIGTTFFNAVFFSGLPILERRNHSFYISHYPKGRDCTVSWGGPDFKWKNDTANWILIRTQVSGGSMTVSLYGTDPGYQVEFTTGPFTNVKPHPVTEVRDPTLTKGAKIIEDTGVDGAWCTVVRTVTRGATVVRTDTFVSHYRPKEEVVRVGTKVPSTPSTGTPGP